jgi:tRNA 2-thiouridine synthesizing protein A
MNKSEITVTQTLDTSGKCCPMPMVDSNKTMKKMQTGDVLEIIATDSGTLRDIPSWCERTGNELLLSEDDGNSIFKYYVKKN